MMISKQRYLLLVSGFLLSGSIAGVAYCSDPDVLPLCTVLVDPVKYNGRMIAVRGVIVETEEGAWLDGSDCQEKLVANGFAWPMLVWLEVSRSRHTAQEFDTLLKSIRKVNDELQLKKFDPAKDRVWLTIKGVLVTHENLGAHVQGGRGTGFGHVNAAPAELMVRTESDPLIERDPKKSDQTTVPSRKPR